MVSLKIIWDDEAKASLRKLYRHIKKDSPQNAIKVREDIFERISGLVSHPTRYPIDQLKLNNDGSVRVFEKHKQRIAYQLCDTEIRIIRLRSVLMEPKLY